MLDDQSEKSNMGPVSIVFHNLGHLWKSCDVFPVRYRLVADSLPCCKCLKGLRAVPTHTDSCLFRSFAISEAVDFGMFALGFGGGKNLQSTGNANGLQIEQPSVRIEPHASVFIEFQDFKD